MAYAGGTPVKRGFYWSAKAWDMSMVPAEGGTLPGDGDRHYARIPTVLFLAMAPVMGALYVVFLPFVGFVLVLNVAARGLKTLVTDLFMNAAAAVAPTWAPGVTYRAERSREKADRAARRARKNDSTRH